MKCLLCDRPFIEEVNGEISLEKIMVFRDPEEVKEILRKLLFLEKYDPAGLYEVSGYLERFCEVTADKNKGRCKPGDIIPFRKG